MNTELINILIIVIIQILSTIFLTKKHEHHIRKGFKRMESSDNSGANDKMAQYLYTMVEPILNFKIDQLLRKSNEGNEGNVRENEINREGQTNG